MSQSHIQEHVNLIAAHEQDFLARRTRAERFGDAMASLVGSLPFVAAHLLLFGAWVGWNVAPRLRHFDPLPFSFLGTLLGLEAIVIASFILMRQARTGRRAEERDHLMLQVLLLSEKEITAVLNLNRQIAQELGLDRAANTREARELSRNTSIEDVAQSIKNALPTE